MRSGVWLRLVGFGLGLAVAVAGGFGAGRLVGPLGERAGTVHQDAVGAPPVAGGGLSAAVAGLAVSASGYTLVAEATALGVGQVAPLRFRILGPDRRPVLRYGIVDNALMQLMVVRRDLSGFARLAPALQADGTWTVPVVLPEPGSWRLIATVAPANDAGTPTPVTLGLDLAVPGTWTPHPAVPTEQESTVDGYTLTLAGTPRVGIREPLLVGIRRDGQPVADLDSPARLVALREGDLAYLPVATNVDQPAATPRFWVAAPSPGRYRLFVDFTTAGTNHTAMFTVTAS